MKLVSAKVLFVFLNNRLRPTSRSMAALLMDTSEDETSSAQSEIHVYEGAGKLNVSTRSLGHEKKF